MYFGYLLTIEDVFFNIQEFYSLYKVTSTWLTTNDVQLHIHSHSSNDFWIQIYFSTIKYLMLWAEKTYLYYNSIVSSSHIHLPHFLTLMFLWVLQLKLLIKLHMVANFYCSNYLNNITCMHCKLKMMKTMTCLVFSNMFCSNTKHSILKKYYP